MWTKDHKLSVTLLWRQWKSFNLTPKKPWITFRTLLSTELLPPWEHAVCISTVQIQQKDMLMEPSTPLYLSYWNYRDVYGLLLDKKQYHLQFRFCWWQGTVPYKNLNTNSKRNPIKRTKRKTMSCRCSVSCLTEWGSWEIKTLLQSWTTINPAMTFLTTPVFTTKTGKSWEISCKC